MDNKETADKDSSANIFHVVPPSVLYCLILDAHQSNPSQPQS